MPWYLWSLIASLTCIGIEWLNRTVGVGRSFWGVLPYSFLPIILAQAGLHQSYSRAPTLLAAWAMFFVGTCSTRLAVTVWGLGEIPSAANVAGVALVVAGACLIKLG